MQFDAAFFFAALALAPGRTRESLRLLLDLPPQALRAGGAALIALGILAAALGICFRS